MAAWVPAGGDGLHLPRDLNAVQLFHQRQVSGYRVRRGALAFDGVKGQLLLYIPPSGYFSIFTEMGVPGAENRDRLEIRAAVAQHITDRRESASG